jgi:hypothetical protein
MEFLRSVHPNRVEGLVGRRPSQHKTVFEYEDPPIGTHNIQVPRRQIVELIFSRCQTQDCYVEGEFNAKISARQCVT